MDCEITDLDHGVVGGAVARAAVSPADDVGQRLASRLVPRQQEVGLELLVCLLQQVLHTHRAGRVHNPHLRRWSGNRIKTNCDTTFGIDCDTMLATDC